MIKVEIDKNLLNWFKNNDKVLEATLNKTLTEIGKHVTHRARANAPILTGDLRKSIGYEVDGDTLVLSSYSPYALTQHEVLRPYGDKPPPYGRKPYWELGPVSAQQPMTPEGGVGGKFFTRVIDYHSETYRQKLNEALRENMVKGQPSQVKVRPFQGVSQNLGRAISAIKDTIKRLFGR